MITSNCLFCLSENTVDIKLDKHSRPYLFCCSCLARAFLHSSRSFIGLRLLAPSVGRFLDEIAGKDRSGYVGVLQQADRAYRETQSSVISSEVRR